MINLKYISQTIKVHRNGMMFQVSTDPMSRTRYFGGGGSSVKAVDPYAGTGFRELFKKFTDFLQPSVGGVTPYPGQQIPGPSPLQQQGFDVAGGLTPIASGGQEYFGNMLSQADPSAPGRYMGMAEEGLRGAIQPFDPSMVTEGLQPGKELALNTFFRDFMPRLKENIVGRAGTADAGALQKLAVQGGEDLSLGLGAQSFPYLMQGQQNQLNRNQMAGNQFMNLAAMPGNILNQAGQIGTTGANLGSNLINAGGIQRGITGQQMGEQYGNWAMQQPYNSPWFNAMGALSGSAPQMDYINQQKAPSLFSQMMPGLGMAAGGYFGGGGTLAGLNPFGGGGLGSAGSPSYGAFMGARMAGQPTPWMGP
jgi:hypothetical protein